MKDIFLNASNLPLYFLLLPNNIKVKPQIGDFYMFPNWLDHSVYPFKSKYINYEPQGERRSFSLNIVFSSNEKNENNNKS